MDRLSLFTSGQVCSLYHAAHLMRCIPFTRSLLKITCIICPSLLLYPVCEASVFTRAQMCPNSVPEDRRRSFEHRRRHRLNRWISLVCLWRVAFAHTVGRVLSDQLTFPSNNYSNMVRTRSEAAKGEATIPTKSSSKAASTRLGKSIRSTALLDSGMTAVVLVVVASLIHLEYIKLSNLVNGDSLSDLGSRLKFILRLIPLSLSWIIFCLIRVSLKRLNSPAINPLANHEDIVLRDSRILQNSFEQFIVSIFAQLAIAPQKVSGPEFSKVICFLNITFIVGRILFFFGYPHRRSFGFITTALPSYAGAIYSLAKLIQLIYVPYI